ncbi:hypothetical protein TNCV_855501 [Trichonephila clavipes]|nr:hypothetical protein TNCV_855501 [Trichonephila clavipes]
MFEFPSKFYYFIPILFEECFASTNTNAYQDNLRRIRDIHEGIQRLRELNTKQIVVHGSSDLEVFQCFVWLPLA